MFCVVIYVRKNWCEVKCVKRARIWGGMYQRYKNISLNKIQRSNVRVLQDKDIKIAVIVKRRLRTADCRLWTRGKMKIVCKMQTAD